MMSPQEQAWQKKVKYLRANLRRSLTAARKNPGLGQWGKVRDWSAAGLQYFENNGYPDRWHEFQIAAEDAEIALTRLARKDWLYQ